MDLATLDLDTALKLLVAAARRRRGPPRTATRSPRRTAATGPTSRRAPTRARCETEQQLFDDHARGGAGDLRPAQAARPGRGTPPLKELGDDPVSGKPVVVKDGRFGPYVTDGETNATLRKDDDPESITPERGYELLAEKRAQGPVDPQAGGQEDDAPRRPPPRRRRRRRRPPRRRRPRRPADATGLPCTARAPWWGARRTSSVAARCPGVQVLTLPRRQGP